MILGVGCDLCDILRIQKSLETHGDTFLERIFLPAEIERIKKRSLKAAGFAKIFAAKEAVVKALGITEGISWQDIEIVKQNTGRPEVLLYGNAKNVATAIAKGDYHMHVSISDEHPYALAYVVFSKS